MLVDGKKDGALVKKLLSTYGLDRLKGLWDVFMRSDDPFICQAGRSIGVFKTQINKLISGTSGSDGNGTRPKSEKQKAWEAARAEYGDDPLYYPPHLMTEEEKMKYLVNPEYKGDS